MLAPWNRDNVHLCRGILERHSAVLVKFSSPPPRRPSPYCAPSPSKHHASLSSCGLTTPSGQDPFRETRATPFHKIPRRQCWLLTAYQLVSRSCITLTSRQRLCATTSALLCSRRQFTLFLSGSRYCSGLPSLQATALSNSKMMRFVSSASSMSLLCWIERRQH